jgi:substrate import-associated zinc metallohydrolase lipoprotein
MSKKMKKILYTICVAAVVAAFSSCRGGDDFTESIFDTTTPAVDESKATYPFDKWLYDNFVVPYNTEIQYEFNFPASQLQYQLTPADYKKSQLLAHFIKYLFYDVYVKSAGEEFMKKYGPRIFHFIGSKAYSPTTETETLGYASGGVKITLINVNEMKLWTPQNEYNAADIERLNKDQFHTMHHEFSHILHQTKSYPVNFGQITPSDYDGRDWQERDSVLSHSLGFLTHYASSATYEDFVETLSCTITDTDCRWMYTIIDACANGGVKEGDKELVYELIDSLQIAGLDEPNKPWNRFKILKETSTDSETGEETERFVPSFHQTDAKANAENAVTYEDETSYMTFREYLDTWVQVDNGPETKGMNAILKKLEIAQKWYTEKWGLYLFQIRKEVKARQSKVNEYVRDNVTIYDL